MRFRAAVLALALGIIACNTGNPEQRDKVFNALYPSPTSDATQTPVIQTVVATKVVQVTTTPVPSVTSTPVRQLCVSADEAVNLRPSPSTKNYKITELENGVVVTDLGGRVENVEGVWLFVEVNENRGWINEKYLEDC